MNEKIKLLAEEAAKKHGHTIKFSPEITETLDSFAELIIKECAEWLKQPVNQTPLSGAVMNIAADRLKEHFGVEE